MDWAGYQKFRPEFEDATDPDCYPIEWLDHQILSGRAWPIIGRRAGIIVEVKHYPGGMKAVHGLVAAGDLREIIDRLIPLGEEWGRNACCRVAIIESRPGWERLLKPRGWDVHQVALRKEL